MLQFIATTVARTAQVASKNANELGEKSGDFPGDWLLG